MNISRFGYLTVGAATLVALASGCATSPRSMDTAHYLHAPARARLSQPLIIQVLDERPTLERQSGRTNSYWRSTSDAGQPGRVAALLAEDLATVLQLKKMAPTVSILVPPATPPPQTALLRVRLLSWYGRVPSSLATDKVSRMLGHTTSFAEGQCHFKTELILNGKTIDLATSAGSFRQAVETEATVEQEGRAVSAKAADEAIAACLRELEDYLRANPVRP
jgi:hypothetical protein